MKHPDRTEREAAALRANLLKRKDQARRRVAGDDPSANAEPASEPAEVPKAPEPDDKR